MDNEQVTAEQLVEALDEAEMALLEKERGRLELLYAGITGGLLVLVGDGSERQRARALDVIARALAAVSC